jgi:glycosyltransferase involved in cell wall biosynthesis
MADKAAPVSSSPEPTVEVLLSTFNGEKFLAAQIESILAQSWRNLRLTIRDDGSRDGTVDVLQEAARDPRVTVALEQNIGATASFFHLLEGVAPSTSFAAFADQDDVWLPEKIARAVSALSAVRADEPALYCSRVFIADENLRTVGETPAWPRPPSFGNALIENIAMGCTSVLNRAAIDLLQQQSAPRNAVQHDWWCYLVIAAFGTVIYDLQPSMSYRLHGRNVVGVKTTPLRRMADKIARQFRQDSLGLIMRQAAEFHARYGGRLAAHRARQLDAVVAARSLRVRMTLAADRSIHRQFPLDDLLWRARLLAGPAREVPAR